MRYALASAIFSIATTSASALLGGSKSPLSAPMIVSLLVIDVILFVLGRRDASSMVDFAANEVEAAEYKALLLLVILLFAVSVVAAGYFLLAVLVPTIF
ncbi:MAG: hypothetical protein JZD41_08280 [Thermoproteus sp.]|nr:hypothetical protein [Thermoproteus sp.]